MLKFFKRKKESPENLEEILKSFQELKKELEKIKKEWEKVKKENQFCLQKVGVVRFNPFKDTGSNQSFSIALLDGNDNGVVITSLYMKEENRVFAKPIKGGKSEYLLTEEEKRAIKLAKNARENNQKTTGSSGFGTH